jgi:hypothetical protein
LQQRGITDADPAAVYDLRRSVERSLVYNRGRTIKAVGRWPVHWRLADQSEAKKGRRHFLPLHQPSALS